MNTARIGFFANLALVIITTSILITYLFKSSENQCQMTFMMEPPKFIPVSIDTLVPNPYHPEKQNRLNRRDSDYKLYMYSEFGFPLSTDVRRDLKDSMPVLFVPGNAGSYQQVRSLASTCIRRQLQSLDAYKFVFYTIDFRGQLSGVSGELVEDQISFLHESINQITSMHPSDTNGIIIVGHSVGGFITKAVFHEPGFDSKSVPLLINLASPLTRPYLNFGTKMRELYQNVSDYWLRRSQSMETISISISGGKSDKLVPMHLSLDNQYDYSLTTSAIRDVWLTTDHVCITWCRELMHKLAHLFSALMDKKNTRLISDRKQALKIINDELITHNVRSNKRKPIVIQKEFRITKSHVTKSINEFYSATRNQLIDELIILNLTNSQPDIDYMIWSEHIDPLKETGIYGCKDVNMNEKNTIICNDKTDLISLSNLIPSRRFEPKKTIITLSRDILNDLNYIVLDFSSSSRETHTMNKVPESISIITTNLQQADGLYVPNVLEYLVNKALSLLFKDRKIAVDHKKQPIVFNRFKLQNLIHSTQFMTASIETRNCPAGAHPKETLASLYYGNYLIESFHPDKNSQATTVKLTSSQPIIVKEDDIDVEDQMLELFLDGNCDSFIHLKLDIWGLIENTIQVHLADILTCSTYFAYVAIIWRVIEFEKMVRKDGCTGNRKPTSWLAGGILLHLTCSLSQGGEHSKVEFAYFSDLIVRFSLICLLACGIIAFLEYVFKRIVDLATITNNLQSIISNRITHTRSRGKIINSNGGACGLAGRKAEKENDESRTDNANENNLPEQKSSHKSLGHNYDWILVVFTLLGSLVFSEALMSVCMLMIIIKVVVSLNAAYYKTQSSDHRTTNRQCCEPTTSPKCAQLEHEVNYYQVPFELLVKLAAMCCLSLLSNIPAALLRINMSKLEMLSLESLLFGGGQFGESFITSVACLLLVKFICETVDSFVLPSENTTHPPGDSKTSFSTSQSSLSHAPSRYLHLFSLIPIALIETNVRCINLVLLILLVWINVRLLGLKTDQTLISRNNFDKTGQSTKSSKHNKID